MKAILTVAVLLSAFLAQTTAAAASSPAAADLWNLARQQSGVHRFSTLFTAQDVRGRLANESGLAAALDWCKRTAVRQVYVECFRDGYQADRTTLTKAMARFRAEGFGVSGCVTPTQVGKRSTGWNVISFENFNDQPAEVELNGRKLAVEPRGWQKMWFDRQSR